MTKTADAQRRKKTLDRKVRDLEDHLHFLREAFAKLAAGDGSYLKPLAAELRVLVCKAGSDGLLWRVISEVNSDDAVDVHYGGKVKMDHPLLDGISFMFFPINRAGFGDPRLEPRPHSLKQIIKEGDALVVQGKPYVHGTLIRAVAEQMGTSHEDDGVQPYLIELSETFVSNIPILSQTLMITADLVLEVGDRAVNTAWKKFGFAKKNRPAVAIPPKWRSHVLTLDGQDFEGSGHKASAGNGLPGPEGSIFFTFTPNNSSWATDDNRHAFDFGPKGPVAVKAIKHPEDRTLEFLATGLETGAASVRKPIPAAVATPLTIAVTWSKVQVAFYLDGAPFGSVQVKQADAA